MAWLTGGTPFRALRQRSDAARRPEKWSATTIVAAHFSIDQAGAPLMWNGTVTMLLATPNALRSLASTVPSWLMSLTTSGASLNTPSWFRSATSATVSFVSTSCPAIGAPTIQVSHSSVSC